MNDSLSDNYELNAALKTASNVHVSGNVSGNNCPNCGYCPHCGRHNYNNPYIWPRWYWNNYSDIYPAMNQTMI